MSLEEFKQSSVRFTKRSTVACLMPMGILLILIFAFVPFQRNVESWLKVKFGEAPGELLAVVPFILGMFMAVLAMLTLLYRVNRQFGIPCVHCNKPLANFSYLVTASRHCPHCGKRVIDLDPGIS